MNPKQQLIPALKRKKKKKKTTISSAAKEEIYQNKQAWKQTNLHRPLETLLQSTPLLSRNNEPVNEERNPTIAC